MHNTDKSWEYYAKWKTQRATYYMICLYEMFTKGKYIDKKQINGCHLQGRGNGNDSWPVYGGFFQGNENTFELEMMFALSCKYAKTTELYTLKSGFYGTWVISQWNS